MNGEGLFGFYRQEAEAAAQRSKPQPAQSVPQPGSVEWFQVQKNKAEPSGGIVYEPRDTLAMPGMLQKSTAFVPRYQKFESISLQRGVCKLSVPGACRGLHAQTAMIENGFVHIPQTAPWLAEYLHEMTVFPRGKHDDQVDSIA